MKHLQNYNKKLNNIVSIIIIWFKFLDWIFSHLGPQGKGASRTTFGSLLWPTISQMFLYEAGAPALPFQVISGQRKSLLYSPFSNGPQLGSFLAIFDPPLWLQLGPRSPYGP